jgi:amino acid transporter
MNIDNENGTSVQKRAGEESVPHSWRSLLIGDPLATADAGHQTIGKVVGLAVFASDALSSTAYATQEMLVILVAAGEAAFHFAPGIAIAIVILLTILTLSYEQTIHAYPGGGGAYIVARDNLGELPAQAAGAALLMDYILTVAVSVSSGVAQIVSAIPSLYDYRVYIAIAMVMFIMVINLRGVKESGKAFAIPTYFFLIAMTITVIIGIVRLIAGTLGAVVDPPQIEMIHAVQPITLFLILKAFASGTTALTGVEAISNGIPAFKEPRSENAGKTLIAMSVILGALLLGITYLSYRIGAVPSEAETVISQLARTAVGGRGALYLAVIIGTTIILVMAANTAFADFPRLGALSAGDGFLPRQLTYRGSRLVYSRGIVALAFIACGLIFLFQASVTKLIPLYAIGVFLSFTLSQTGMARRWYKSGHLKPGEQLKERGSTISYDKHRKFKMIVNSIGSVSTAVVMMVFAITKFQDGAWIVLLLLPTLISIFFAIHHHYKKLAQQLSLDQFSTPPRMARHRVILPLGGVHRGSVLALHYARLLSEDITAVYVSIDAVEEAKIRQKWDMWGEGTRLVIVESPYRRFIEPLIKYINEVDKTRAQNEVITIVVPEFVPRVWWHQLLHTQTARVLRMALIFHRGIVITSVPYQVG